MKAIVLSCMILLFFISCSRSPNRSDEHAENADSAVRSDSMSIADLTERRLPKPVRKDSLSTDQKVNPAPEADPIAFIREQVSHTNTSPLEKKHFEYMCDEMTRIDYFYGDGEIKKISIDFGAVGDVYSREDYYYHDGKLIFIYKFHELLMPCNGCDQIKEYRSYIQDDQVIRNLKDQEPEKCSECHFSPKSKKYRLLKAKTASEMKAILCG